MLSTRNLLLLLLVIVNVLVLLVYLGPTRFPGVLPSHEISKGNSHLQNYMRRSIAARL